MPGPKRKSKRNPVAVVGNWVPMPLELLKSRAFAQLSPKASRLFLDLLSQMGVNGSGNGDLEASPATMAKRGWKSNADRTAALHELERAELLVVTRRGDRRRPNLYALTAWPLACDLAKLDITPGAYRRTDWQRDSTDLASPPSEDRPAVWNALRKDEKSQPITGQPTEVIDPSRVNKAEDSHGYRPITGPYRAETPVEVDP